MIRCWEGGAWLDEATVFWGGGGVLIVWEELEPGRLACTGPDLGCKATGLGFDLGWFGLGFSLARLGLWLDQHACGLGVDLALAVDWLPLPLPRELIGTGPIVTWEFNWMVGLNSFDGLETDGNWLPGDFASGLLEKGDETPSFNREAVFLNVNPPTFGLLQFSFVCTLFWYQLLQGLTYLHHFRLW